MRGERREDFHIPSLCPPSLSLPILAGWPAGWRPEPPGAGGRQPPRVRLGARSRLRSQHVDGDPRRILERPEPHDQRGRPAGHWVSQAVGFGSGDCGEARGEMWEDEREIRVDLRASVRLKRTHLFSCCLNLPPLPPLTPSAHEGTAWIRSPSSETS
jgi:hypothetical protein